MTALDFANDRSNIIVRYASTGTPAGRDVAWIPPETWLPFELSEVSGTVSDGVFTADMVRGFTDFKANTITGIWLRADCNLWAEQHAEFMGN